MGSDEARNGVNQDETGERSVRPAKGENDAHVFGRRRAAFTPYEWTSIVLELLLFIVGAFYTFYAAKQWDAMKSALKQTDESIRLAKEALLQTTKSADAALYANHIGASSLAVSQSAIAQNERSFQVDERPYLAATFAGDPQSLRNDPYLSLFNVHFKDVGKTPALHAITYIDMFLARKDDGEMALIDKHFSAVRRASLSRKRPPETVVLPGEEVFVSGRLPTPLTDAELSDYTQRRIEIVVASGVVYRDLFGTQHETQSCATMYGPPRLYAPELCAKHNTIR